MKSPSSANRPKPTQLTPEAQAAALWAYVQAKVPRFSMDAAREVANRLDLRPDEAPKSLAKRLRIELQKHRVKLKHTNALQAASHLAGFTSWHTNEGDDVYRLTFATFDADLMGETHFRSWDELAAELRSWADRLLARGQLPLGVLTLNFTGQVLNLSTPVPPEKDHPQQSNQAWPLGTITSAIDEQQWLDGASAALEKLRRHLEENGHAVLDGYAVLRLCADSLDQTGHPMAVTASDVVNSELVLLREDFDDEPNSGYEIARGDELTCWHQLELSLRKDGAQATPSVEVTIPNEGAGAWHVNGIRYVWAVETLKPQAYVPGRVNRQIGITDCERLLRRYKLAKRIHGKAFKHHEQAKHVDYLGGPPESYRIDLHFLLLQLNRANLTWESYIENFGAEPLPMTNTLPVGFVFQLLENLQIDKPNQIFARPNLSEMARVDDDGLLRALMSRVEHVRYVTPSDLDEVRVSALSDVVEEFASGLHAQKMFTSGGLQMGDELPHLVWATDAEEFRLAGEALGLVMHAAVMPHLHSTKGILPDVPDMKVWPWAFGNALFLRFEHDGSQQ
ncbi:hypothetical protein SAMN04515618_10895 [Collimonas sp. OK307]|uniref:hypothetical protein n=1 Tax=Collimonas sp. OK307 TaxID=1801620 RepID=UPI0008EFE246|nr:hypothetical protein [Collimonas sp. OK307]SFI03061.1 hypothetical protein SAMN04515618_10895 [Collimonas sp. OK307]